MNYHFVKVFQLKSCHIYNFRGDLVQLHDQFNNSVLASKTTRNDLHKLTSLYDLSLFNLNTNSVDLILNPYEKLSIKQIRSRYFSPHSFAQVQSKLSKN